MRLRYFRCNIHYIIYILFEHYWIKYMTHYIPVSFYPGFRAADYVEHYCYRVLRAADKVEKCCYLVLRAADKVENCCYSVLRAVDKLENCPFSPNNITYLNHKPTFKFDIYVLLKEWKYIYYAITFCLLQLSTGLYDTNNDIHFDIINCPHIDNNIPTAPRRMEFIFHNSYVTLTIEIGIKTFYNMSVLWILLY